MSLFLIEGIEDKNVENPVLDLARSVDRVAKELDLAKMSHAADLTWVLGELKSIIANWGDDEYSQAVVKEKAQHLKAALIERITEVA